MLLFVSNSLCFQWGQLESFKSFARIVFFLLITIWLPVILQLIFKFHVHQRCLCFMLWEIKCTHNHWLLRIKFIHYHRLLWLICKIANGNLYKTFTTSKGWAFLSQKMILGFIKNVMWSEYLIWLHAKTFWQLLAVLLPWPNSFHRWGLFAFVVQSAVLFVIILEFTITLELCHVKLILKIF